MVGAVLMCASSSAARPAGTAICWGWDFAGECTPPAGHKFVKVSAGHRFTLGINAQGQIIHWGSTYHGRGDVPSGNIFVDVSAGYDHGLALDAVGNVYAWGGGDPDAGGDLGQGTQGDTGEHTYTAIAAGEAFSLALRSNGTIAHWGRNWEQQHLIPDNDANAPGFSPYVAIDAGGHHGIGLKANGSVRVWGAVNYQSCTTQGVLPSFPGETHFIAIGAGHYTSYAIRSDRSVEWWGCTGCNPAQQNTMAPPSTFQPDDETSPASVDAGYHHALGRTTQGRVVAWGGPCALGGGTVVFDYPNTVPSFLSEATVLSIGTGHSNAHNVIIIMD